jgi:hypothetical protein
MRHKKTTGSFTALTPSEEGALTRQTAPPEGKRSTTRQRRKRPVTLSHSAGGTSWTLCHRPTVVLIRVGRSLNPKANAAQYEIGKEHRRKSIGKLCNLFDCQFLCLYSHLIIPCHSCQVHCIWQSCLTEALVALLSHTCYNFAETTS